MPLTTAQVATLKTAIAAEADSTFVALRNAGATGAMAEWFNLPNSFIVWRTRVTKAELTNSTTTEGGGTVFSWVNAGFISRSQGERDAWRELFDADGIVNPSLPQVRAAFSDIFSGGTAPAPANRTHLAAVSKRPATRGERIFATGTGTTAVPGLLTFEGAIANEDVVRALA